MKEERELEKNLEAAGGDDVAENSDTAAEAGASTPPSPASQATLEAKKVGVVWSSDSAEYLPLAAGVWSQIGDALAGTRYAIGAEEKDFVELEVAGGTAKLAPKVKTLAEGTAPLLAKYVPQVAKTPETAFVVAVALVFGPPAIKHGAEVLGDWWQKRKSTIPQKAA